jgi:hypothetical protein
MITARMRSGTGRTEIPQGPKEKPAFTIDRLADLFGIIQQRT